MKNLFKKVITPIITWQAMHTIGRFRPKIISITGTVGKTSTKDAIYELLKEDFNVRKSEKSFNSEIGVPLTILGLSNAWTSPIKWTINIIKGFFISFFSTSYPKVLILEVGADKKGDIESVASWVNSSIVVITALSDVPVHVENFGSPELLYEEKSKLLKSLSKKDGIAVLNADDSRVMNMKNLTSNRVITFGLENADISIGEIYKPNVSNPYPVLAAAAVAKALGISPEKIKELSKNIQSPPGRMRELRGINNSIIIDDTYNSSPIALESALETLKNFSNNGRKIAVLGDMLELGQFSEAEHRRMGAIAAQAADILVVIGQRARWIFEEAKKISIENPDSKVRDFKVCEDSLQAADYLKNIIQEGDVVLAKGSQGVRVEKAIEPVVVEEDKKFLVRQDKEWKGR